MCDDMFDKLKCMLKCVICTMICMICMSLVCMEARLRPRNMYDGEPALLDIRE